MVNVDFLCESFASVADRHTIATVNVHMHGGRLGVCEAIFDGSVHTKTNVWTINIEVFSVCNSINIGASGREM
jgi:hypothetical protein